MVHPLFDRDDWRSNCRHVHGRVLTGDKAHWCPEWDFDPIDDTVPEFESCTCYPTKPNDG